MSIRASLYVGSGAKAKAVSEAKTWLPLLWLALPSADDVARGIKTGCIESQRAEAVKRLTTALPFFEGLFPEFSQLPEYASELLAILRRSRSATITIEMGDHFAIAEDTFPVALTTTVGAIEARDPKCSLNVPAREIANPFGGKPLTIKELKLINTRDVVSFTAGINLATKEKDIIRDYLVGYLG
ncbi:MAG: hypothetical protein R3B84_14310 [Zavarzinella sp.]